MFGRELFRDCSARVQIAGPQPAEFGVLLDRGVAFLAAHWTSFTPAHDYICTRAGHVIVPPAVIMELNQERTPDLVKAWLSNMPEWLHVQAPMQALTSPGTILGAGEREAIALAAELSADALLMDDRDARQEAKRLGVPVLGTLRVLVDASERGLANLSMAFDRLRGTNFRASEQLLRRLLEHSAHPR